MSEPVRRTVLQALPLPQFPGWESRLVLLEYAPGAIAPPHTHPIPGTNYIVEGTLLSQWEGEDVRQYVAGDTFLDKAEVLHSRIDNASATEKLTMVASYVVRVGQPNVVVVGKEN